MTTKTNIQSNSLESKVFSAAPHALVLVGPHDDGLLGIFT